MKCLVFIRDRNRAQAAFTLLEVAIASVILAMALFAILRICTVCLKGTRLLSRVHVDATSLAAELSLTNRLEEGGDSGTFGDAYPGYSWSRSITEYTTNGLYQVDFEVLGRTKEGTEDRSGMTILLYRPDTVRRVGR